ncbi:MAG: tRNA (adenosine(37)-N6)-dimethylallyltransferase MiaA [Pirellulales bacterium]|nr:tRNA (adenosine(37)-N6)-dimethylallyltransferase MiaA [Pirellulales bacterium]
MTNPLHAAWYLTGPTAGGKTAVSLELASALQAEILSLDSMAIYRGMDIGTAKPTLAERALVPHHLLDLRDPHEEFSLAEYRDAALAAVNEILARGKLPLFVGGTPLYLKSLLRGLYSGPEPNWPLRHELAAQAAKHGPAYLHDQLRAVDPHLAAKLHPADERRIIRGLEVYQLTGEPLSRQQQHFDQPVPQTQVRVFLLDWPRAELYSRINQRVENMFTAGLVDETASLLAAPHPPGRTARQAVGYREVIEHLQGKRSLAETISLVQQKTRNFAKHQATWFRGLSECRVISVNSLLETSQIREMVLQAADLPQHP